VECSFHQQYQVHHEIKLIIFISSLSLKSQEVEETLKRIQQHKGVVGTIVVNNEGEPYFNSIRSHASLM
jgi:hypothetical protein